ncbi:hypothetical protein ACFL0U_02260 [Pseudomonadota bacterium]
MEGSGFSGLKIFSIWINCQDKEMYSYIGEDSEGRDRLETNSQFIKRNGATYFIGVMLSDSAKTEAYISMLQQTIKYQGIKFINLYTIMEVIRERISKLRTEEETRRILGFFDFCFNHKPAFAQDLMKKFMHTRADFRDALYMDLSITITSDELFQIWKNISGETDALLRREKTKTALKIKKQMSLDVGTLFAEELGVDSLETPVYCSLLPQSKDTRLGFFRCDPSDSDLLLNQSLEAILELISDIKDGTCISLTDSQITEIL